MGDVLQIAAIVIGNSGLIVVLEKIIESKSKTRKTIRAMLYNMISDKLNYILSKGYATETDRRDVQILWAAYHGEGWNGDMDDRMQRMIRLPFHPDEELEVHKNEKQVS